MLYIIVLVKFNKYGEIISTQEPCLRPMTHQQAVTFRSKMPNPSSWLIVEVTQEVLVQCRNYWLKNLWEHYRYRDGYFHICSFREALYFEELIQNA